MRKLALIVASLFLFLLESSSKTYYFSSSNGNDNHSVGEAQNPNSPWKTLDHLNVSMDLLMPGDSILFKRGDTFTGQIVLTCSGSLNSKLVFSAYGSGPVPIIKGTRPITEWAHAGGNIWSADCPSIDTAVTNFFINGISQQIGRYPNADDPNSGYLNIDAHGGRTVILSNSLHPTPDWSGGDAVLRTKRYYLDRVPIQSHESNELQFPKPTKHEILDDYGFFIQNHLNTLDRNGEWYFDQSNSKLYIYQSLDPNTMNTEVTSYSSIFVTRNQHDFEISQLEFRGSSNHAILIESSENIIICNNLISDSGNDGAHFLSCTDVSIIGNTIRQSNSKGITFDACHKVQVKDNDLFDIGLRAGMGVNYTWIYSAGTQYTGIYFEGTDITCELNRIDSVGYNGIYFTGNDISIKKNNISHFCITLDDGGGIYTGGDGNTIYSNRFIEKNIVINGIGAGHGTRYPALLLAEGIYMDDRSNNAMILDNTVANCVSFGIYIHNSNNISIIGNTSYNNGTQLVFAHDPVFVEFPITNCVVENNIFFSRLGSQLVADFRVVDKSKISQFGSFNNNHYCRPINEEETIRVLKIDESSGNEVDLLDLSKWQNNYNYDLNSSVSPKEISSFSVESVDSDKIPNGNFGQDISGWTCVSNYNNCLISWDNTGILDQGSMKLKFNGLSGNADGFLAAITAVSDVSADQDYVLRFSMLSSQPDGKVSMLLRNYNSPGNVLASSQVALIGTDRKEYELLFSPDMGAASATVDFTILEDANSYWMDNVELYEATVQLANIEDSLSFVYNPVNTSSNYYDDQFYIDARGDKYHNFILQPFSSLVLFRVSEDYYGINPSIKPVLYALVYPNPASYMIDIITNDNSNKTITIIDISGRTVYEEQTSLRSKKIDVSSLSKGPYIILIRGIESYSYSLMKLIIV